MLFWIVFVPTAICAVVLMVFAARDRSYERTVGSMALVFAVIAMMVVFALFF